MNLNYKCYSTAFRLTVIFLFLTIAFTTWSRPLPLRDFKVKRTILVDSLTGDDNQKIQAALALIPRDGTTTMLLFSNRVYRVSPAKGSAVFKLKGLKNLIIDGNHCTFLFVNSSGRVVDATDCENLICKNYNVDFDPLPFTQGEIVKVDYDKKNITVKKDVGFPSFTAEHFGSDKLTGSFQDRVFSIVRDKNRSGMHKRGSSNCSGMNYIMDRGNDEFEIGFNRASETEVGDIFVIIAHKSVNGATHQINNGKQITLMDINVYSGGVGVNGVADCLNLIRFQIKPKPGTGRLQSICRDGFMLGHNKVGPWLEGCAVETNGDDGVNFHTRGFAFKQNGNLSPTTAIFTKRSFGSGYKTAVGEKGDLLVFYDIYKGVELCRTKILSAVKINTTDFKFTLDKDLPQQIDFNDPECENKYAVFNLAYSADGFVIKNCNFKYVRRHALFLLQGENGIIENNYFKQTAGCVLNTGIEITKSIGYGLENTVFRNNRAEDCYVAKEARAGGGWITGLIAGGENEDIAVSNQIVNLTIENNQFIQSALPTIQFSNTKNLVCRNNTFQLENPYSIKIEQLIKLKTANLNPDIVSNTILK